MRDDYDFNENLEYCEFRMYNLTREKRRIDRITGVLNNIAASKNSLVRKLYELKYSFLTISDKAVIDMDYKEAYDYYVYRINGIDSETLQVEEEYRDLIKDSVEANKMGKN